MSRDIDLPHDVRHNTKSIKGITKAINTLANQINAVDGKVDFLFERSKLEDKKKEERGTNKYKNCMYLEDGYCTEEHHCVDPETAEVNILKKDFSYHPQVTWVDCEICDHCNFRP